MDLEISSMRLGKEMLMYREEITSQNEAMQKATPCNAVLHDLYGQDKRLI
jgi:hypothetical protein